MLQVSLCYLQIKEHLTKQILILEVTARKIKQSEAVISGLKKHLDEYKSKCQQSEAVNSGFKKQLEIKEEVLKNNKETQKQLQTDIYGLTKTVDSLNQAIQRLGDTPKHVSTYNIAAVALSKWTEISPDISRVKLFLV
jgi:chromosome segregation ATPase